MDLFKIIQTGIDNYGVWIYALLCLTIFVETGMVIMPILPGDSLLFATGAIAATSPEKLNPFLLFVLLTLAALAGDNVNYWLGHFLGPKVFKEEKTRFFKRSHLERTRAFYDKYGGKTVIMARFVPIVRTFAPFVAGVGSMTYLRFLAFSIVGAMFWVGSCVSIGYFFGGIPIIKKRFELVVIAIVLISVLPMAREYWKHRKSHSAPPSD